MPTAVLENPVIESHRKRWTRSECAVLEESGAWDQQRLELIDGELIDKMGKNRPHAISLSLLNAWLIGVFGPPYVNSETTIDVSPEDNPTNEPQPDVIVFRRPSYKMRRSPPTPGDILLLVEISDTSLGFDLRVKAPLYARAGIPEYWVADIAGRRIIVHRDPREGAYATIEAYSEEESVCPLAAPGHAFPVREAFLE